MKSAIPGSLLALLALACLLVTAPVSADSLGFTVKSLQTEDAGSGC